MHNGVIYYNFDVRKVDPVHPVTENFAKSVTLPMSATRIGHLLDTDPSRDLGKIVRRAREMGDLTARLRAALPEPAASALLAANVHEDGSLVVICSSPSWASRLRFESERLLAAAAEAGVRVERLRVRVTTPA